MLVILMSADVAWAQSATSGTGNWNIALNNNGQSEGWLTDASEAWVIVRFDKQVYLSSFSLKPYYIETWEEFAPGHTYKYYDYKYTPDFTKIEGSNNQSSWTTLYEGETGLTDFKHYIPQDAFKHELNTAKSYQYYKVTISKQNSNKVGVNSVSFECYPELHGSGTVSDPYIIANAPNWCMFVAEAKSHSDICCKFNNDITLSDDYQSADLESFSGRIDGCGFALRNVPSPGLVSKIGAAAVSNLSIESSEINCTDAICGAFAAYAYGTTFTNCYVVADFTYNTSVSQSVGGMIGDAAGNTTFNNCYVAINLDNQQRSSNLYGSAESSVVVSNCYFYSSDTPTGGLATPVSKTDINNGRLAYLLNGSQDEEPEPYYQKIGTEAYPILRGNNYVYLALDNASYTNSCPHRDLEHHDIKHPTCIVDGKAEYGVCKNKHCKKIFFSANRSLPVETEEELTLSIRAVNVKETNLAHWTYMLDAEKDDVEYYNVMQLKCPKLLSAKGDYAVSYTVLDDNPTMNLHLFYRANFNCNYKIRFYVNGVEREDLQLSYNSITDETNVTVAIDGLHKHDCIKVLSNYSHSGSNNESYYSVLFIGTEKPVSTSHILRKKDSEYDCIEGGYYEHYICDVCGNCFNENIPTDDSAIVPIENFWIAPVGEHNFGKLPIEGNLYGYKCENDICAKRDPENYILVNYNNDTDMPLTYDDGTYTAKESVSLTDAKAYNTPVPFVAETMEYQRTFYPNVWNPWIIPFNVTVSELEDNGITDVATIESIHNYDTDDDGEIDKTVLEVILKKAGMLKAGVPYLAKTGDTYTYPMIFADRVMKASNDITNMHSETFTSAYDVEGTYSGIDATVLAAGTYYSLDGNGNMVHRTQNILPQRWYIKEVFKENPYDDAPAPALSPAFVIRVIGEEDDVTGIRTIYDEDKQTEELMPEGIYDMRGHRLSAPQHGKVNIINGKKIYVK